MSRMIRWLANFLRSQSSPRRGITTAIAVVFVFLLFHRTLLFLLSFLRCDRLRYSSSLSCQTSSDTCRIRFQILYRFLSTRSIFVCLTMLGGHRILSVSGCQLQMVFCSKHTSVSKSPLKFFGSLLCNVSKSLVFPFLVGLLGYIIFPVRSLFSCWHACVFSMIVSRYVIDSSVVGYHHLWRFYGIRWVFSGLKVIGSVAFPAYETSSTSSNPAAFKSSSVGVWLPTAGPRPVLLYVRLGLATRLPPE